MAIKVINILIYFTVCVFYLLYAPKLQNVDFSFLQIIGIDRDFKPGVIHILYANVLASFITLVLLLRIVFSIKWTFDRGIFKLIFKYGWPIMVAGVAYVINENLDKLMIAELLGKSANGVYAACYKLGVFMTLYTMAFRLGAEPFFFRQSGQADAKEKYKVIMTWFVIFGAVCALVVTLFIDVWAGFLLKQKFYHEALYIVPILLIANLFSGIYLNLSIWYKLSDKTRIGMYISILGAIITIVSLYIFIVNFGIIGGAIATLITYTSMAVVSWFLGKSYYPIDYEIGKIVMVLSIVAIASYFSFVWFRGQWTVNVLLLISSVVLFALLQKSDIQKLSKK